MKIKWCSAPLIRGISVIGLFCLSMSASVYAFDEAPKVLDDMVITATKRDSSLDDFSGSISVKDELFIGEHTIEDLNELTRFIPNVYFKKATSGDAVVSRGISTVDTSLFSPMGLYIDDIAYPLSYMQNQNLQDVQRVEVLRGPQGTLYGRNSESGVIHVVLKEPDNEKKVSATLEAGNNASWSGAASVSGPIKEEVLYFGLSLSGLRSDGFMENEVTGQDNVADNETVSARGTLRWTPLDELQISATLDGTERDMGVSTLRFADGPEASPRFKVRSTEEDATEERERGGVVKLRWQADAVEVTSISGNRRFTKDFVYDFDRTPKKLGTANLDVDTDNWSQEFRLASSEERRLSWLVGLFGFHEELDTTMTFKHINPVMASDRITDSENEGCALFGQASYEVTPRFKATAGLRWDYTSSAATQGYTSNTGTTTFDATFSQTEWLPIASASYAFRDNLTAYTTWSRGWLAGGFNHFTATSEANFRYDAEYTDNYEIGFKTHSFDRRLKADLSLFYITIDDKQVKEEVLGGGASIWKFSNAAKAHTSGFELEIDALLRDNLEFFSSIGLAVSKIERWEGNDEGIPVDYSGNAMPWAPEFTWSAGMGYYMDNGLYGVVDLFGTGAQYFDAANTLKEEGYALANAKVGYTWREVDLSIYCKNFLDTEYATKKIRDNAGFTMVEDGEPLTFGVILNWRL